MAQEHFDVLIIGAGLSGIDAAYHLQRFCPNKTYVILEQRAQIGGTWDLFRYPGIRSDSDMLTMGYSFRPWTSPKTISPGEDIRNYITAAAQDSGIDHHIRFQHKIVSASWSSQNAAWTVTAKYGEESVTLSCNFLFSCAGYYRYSAGYLPAFPNVGQFQGPVIHPQAWPGDLDFAGKRVVIIGSGATAVTLVPNLAKTAAHVTMLQRSPGYVVSLPEQDPFAHWLRARVSPTSAYHLCRWKSILLAFCFYQLAQFFPNLAKAAILKTMARSVGPNCDVPTPRYNPWQQRLCLVPNGDMFKAVKSGRASIVTGEIRNFGPNGIQLASGQTLEADIVVASTGLVFQYMGDIKLSVDGRAIDFSQTLSYKGVLNSGVPNLASVFGYINASWTLKADLICRYVCRLLNFMDKGGMRQVTPRDRGEPHAAPFIESFSSGYVQRSLHNWPKQGAKAPWRVHQNYFRDIVSLRWSSLNDGTLEFSNPTPTAAAQQAPRDFNKTAVGS